ncbi:conidiation-specific expression protein [Parahypoxylon ruwenzoriense]
MPTESQVAGGHKATLHNPNTSKEAKEHSKQILETEFNEGGAPKSGDDGSKNPSNVAAGLKA